MLSYQLLEKVKEQLISNTGVITEIEIAQALRTAGALESGPDLLELAKQVKSQLVGYGPLEELMRQDGITDLLIHGDGRVFIDGINGMHFVGKLFSDSVAVRRYAQRLSIQAGRRLDDAHPWVDAKLGDGNRLHALLPPISVGGPQISIRVPSRRPFSILELVESGCLTPGAANDLQEIISNQESFIIIGGTGAGKTSLLASLLSIVDTNQRIVAVEEHSELSINHPHFVQLEARPATAEGVGFIGMPELVRQTLRMRPDRIVVGEVRGAEVLDLLLAINTGHRGSAATLHANSSTEVISRIQGLGFLAGVQPETTKEWLLHGISKIIEIKRFGNKRFVTAVAAANSNLGRYQIECEYHSSEARAA
jgi:pilus assembly protein CpaF